MDIFNSIISQIQLSADVIPEITISTILDISLVSYVTYNILIWIRETRAWSLLKGLAVLLGISVISYMFNFYTITWIISNTFSVGLIAIVVLFQSEIRKALESLGTNNKLSGFIHNMEYENSRLSAQTLDSIITAIMEMASDKTGAIIVIENNVPLGDLQQTGIPIDAVVTSQLLINIFEDKTPLHDGAILIRSNRISAGACILPLTTKEIGKELGTRHRAAVGASEVSDAYILVSSEESGFVSLAHEGVLYKNVNEEQIRKKVLYKPKDSSDKKKKSKWKGRKNK